MGKIRSNSSFQTKWSCRIRLAVWAIERKYSPGSQQFIRRKLTSQAILEGLIQTEQFIDRQPTSDCRPNQALGKYQ